MGVKFRGRPSKDSPPVPGTGRFDSWDTWDIVAMIESSLDASAEVRRGFHRPDVENDYVVHELQTNLRSAYDGLETLRKRLERGDSAFDS